jgi:putative heme-binding domain-containing protein
MDGHPRVSCGRTAEQTPLKHAVEPGIGRAWARRWAACVWVLGVVGAGAFSTAYGQTEAQWIWSPRHAKDAVPVGESCHFRKQFTLSAPESGQVLIAADDGYELFINGRRVGAGETTRTLDEYDVSRYLVRGPNVIAVKVTNTQGTTAALTARVLVKDRGAWHSFSSDTTWRTALKPLPLWHSSLYNDRTWELAQSFGPLGATAPWDRREQVGASDVSRGERFVIDPQFEVQRVLDSTQVGSLIAMTFNEFGHILASQEGKGLLLIYDSNGDKIPDRVRPYCERVTNIQGILALNGEVFVTGEGPDGPGLYRLSDQDRDGVLEQVRTLLKFRCSVAEHGPHGVVLGPDGLLYVLLGNHAALDGDYDAASPYRDFYDTDLVPKYEDPGGHAVGIKAPGGVILRTDIEGSAVQLVAGGLRNPYDLTFHRDGELFIHDADMESDEGTSWYRPTRVCHIVPGGEYGWRSGWSKWPETYFDSLPAVIDTGRGSPAGITAYNHFMFPMRYHGALFTADWSQGRILVIKLKRQGASYTATSEVFLEGHPLNVTDLEVGPDGWLYFCTGGRGTSGGIYRVTWKGQVPEDVRDIGTGLTAVIRQPQPGSSFARQNLATLRRQLGSAWDRGLPGVARTAANPPIYRLQALELMQLFGPPPPSDLLVELSQAPSELLRGRAAELMGLGQDQATATRLVALLEDPDRSVRRKACEALARRGQAPPLEKLLPLLASDDRFEAWAARRLLERMPPEQWRDRVLHTDHQRLLVQGGLALMIAHPSRDHALAVLEQLSQAMNGFVSDREFRDMLRLMQVALVRGRIQPEEVPGLKRQLAEEFPSGDSFMNRELIRLLAFFQESSILDRYLEYLASDAPESDRLHVALHLRFLEDGWTPAQRLALLRFYELANQRRAGGSYARYVLNVTRDVCRQLSEEESRLVLTQGEQWPNAALGALYQLPAQLDAPLRETLIALDRRISEATQGAATDALQRLQVGLIAVLARSGDEASLAYLREVWDQWPERRQTVALGLAQHPDGENWDYLVRSLPILEPAAGREVCARLTYVDRVPDDPEVLRQVILLALKMRRKEPEKADAAANALGLLTFWTDQELAEGKSEDEQLAAWQQWFREKFPQALDPSLPVAAETARYTVEDLLSYLASEQAAPSARRGAAVFVKAQCAKCHRFDGQGESVGPDLTTVANRFTRKELLEAILHPSQVISSQYASQTILTTDGRQLTGLVVPGTAGQTVVILPSAERVSLDNSQIEATRPSKISAMPEGLLDALSQEEIADLIAYLMRMDSPGPLAGRPGGTTAK